MATLQEVQSSLEELKNSAVELNTGMDAVLAAIQALKDQIAQGGSVTPTDLDGLQSKVAEVQAILAEIRAKEVQATS